MMPQEGADLEIDPDPQVEREADEAAQEALSGEDPLVINRMGTDVHIQRSAKGDSEYVTRDEVLEIVDNYYRGRLEEQAEMDPLEQGETRESSQGVLDETGIDTAAEQSLLGRLKDAVTNNFGSDGGIRNLVEGTVSGTLAVGTIAATVLSGGTVIPAAAAASVAASTMAPALRGVAADAVSPQDDVPLTDRQLEKVAEKIEKMRAEDDLGGDSQGVGSSGEVTKE